MLRDFMTGVGALVAFVLLFFSGVVLISGMWFGFADLALLRNVQLLADFALITLICAVLAGLLFVVRGWLQRKISN